jgi:hypothetical protein
MSIIVIFKLLSLTVPLNAPVYFDLEIASNSNEGIALDLGHNYKTALSFTVETPAGDVVEVPPLSSSGLGTIGGIEVEAGGSYKRRYVLNEWYRFAAPGKCSIQAHLSPDILAASGAVVQHSTMELTVTPRDPQALEKICEELLNQLSNTTNAEQIANAALALSYVTDPVAVSYISEALKRRRYSWQHLIPGLAEIGTQEAIDLLKQIEKQGDNEAGAALARYYLEALADGTVPERRDGLYVD